ncbi:protein of unknown function [Magnetospirillum sp. XM-1]|uniref:FecR family protein n=1 Tax=Magnetospirillum sp. XM-1 TaxID=1663591 RepID=UPI00073E0793|nr:FecR domain-containing protein [Magnetospirillum sp. XM-1]CUW39505.1 protein of unknown function [Magnetospirillum sp. XM-1]
MTKVLVPEGGFLLSSEFFRKGADLILVRPDGSTVVILDYFANDAPPPLVSDAGALIEGALVTRLAGPLAPGQYAQADGTPSSGSPQIGMVDKVAGSVTARHADGTSTTLQKGDVVFQGDVIHTSGDGSVGLVFADRSTFSLGNAGKMVLDQLVYDPDTHQGKAEISVAHGAFGLVSGQIAHSSPDAMIIKTPAASLGIRGTTVAGRVDEQGQTQVALLGDPGGGTGEVVLRNSSGSQILGSANTLIQIVSASAPPSLPVPVAPTVIAQSFGSAVSSLPPPPPPGRAMEWSTAPGKDQVPPIKVIQERPNAGAVLDISHPEGTKVVDPSKLPPEAKAPQPDKAITPDKTLAPEKATEAFKAAAPTVQKDAAQAPIPRQRFRSIQNPIPLRSDR